MRAVLLVDDNGYVTDWQYRALETAVACGLEITLVAVCDNTSVKRNYREHFGYYLFAAVTRRRMPASRQRHIRDLVSPDVPWTRFSSLWEGQWQRIPDETTRSFSDADLVIKFGMNLLRGIDSMPVTYGVVSYHHGDPRTYRGRPAGYYELRQGTEVQGVIVQLLGATLDGGKILAEAYTNTVTYSYRRTLQNAYEAGVPLLARAIDALASDAGRSPDELGPNYRLPSNQDVTREALRLCVANAKHLAYGMFREKKWRVAYLTEPIEYATDTCIEESQLSILTKPKMYSFIADPFVVRESVYCEGLNRHTGKGEILRFLDGRWDSVNLGLGGGHVSYPQLISDSGSLYMLPEMASIAGPHLILLDTPGLKAVQHVPLRGLEDHRVLDATLFAYDGRWYLFGGSRASSADQLELWHADSLNDPFQLHPASPIRMDPRGSRMAGGVLQNEGRVYRFGQDATSNYGAFVHVFEIDVLSSFDYKETPCGSIRIDGKWGPHTLSVADGAVWLDFYEEITTPMAGVRRLRAKLGAMRPQGSGE